MFRLNITSLWLICFITGSLYFLLPFTFSTHAYPLPSNCRYAFKISIQGSYHRDSEKGLGTWILTSASMIMRQVAPPTWGENSALKGNQNPLLKTAEIWMATLLWQLSKFLLRGRLASEFCCSLKKNGCLWCSKMSLGIAGLLGPQRDSPKGIYLIKFFPALGLPQRLSPRTFLCQCAQSGRHWHATTFPGTWFVNNFKGEMRLLSKLDVGAGQINRLQLP